MCIRAHVFPHPGFTNPLESDVLEENNLFGLYIVIIFQCNLHCAESFSLCPQSLALVHEGSYWDLVNSKNALVC